MKYFFAFLFIFSAVSSFSQKKNTQTATDVYKVKSAKTVYEFFPPDSFLFRGYSNRLIITQKENPVPYEVSINNGNVQRINDTVFILTNLERSKIMLSIFEMHQGGKRKLSLNKEFSVFNYPVVEIGGVKCDYAINNLVLATNPFVAHYPGTNLTGKVHSFKMDYLRNGQFVTDSCNSDKLKKEMRQYVGNLKAQNTLIYFKDIRFLS